MRNPDILILAVSRMRGGVCVAGMTTEADAVTGLRWVRPVKAHGMLLLGDIRYEHSSERPGVAGTLMRPGDVVAWRLGAACPDPPHVEDVLVDAVRDRAAYQRRLDAERRARFCAAHLDGAAADVLIDQTRSLCLVRPDAVGACWSYDAYNGHYEARMVFAVGGFATGERGVAVTDLAWRALGRTWLRGTARLELDGAALRERVGEIFLTVGRGRLYEGRHWPLVVGVHAAGLPEVAIDDHNL